MTQACVSGVTEAVDRAIAALDLDRLERDYWEQNEFLYIPQFLPREFVEAELTSQAQALKSGLNRNYIPGHKKGGSVSYYTVREQAPQFMDLYRSDAFRAMLNRLTRVNLLLCPDNDPHSCALYYYTEAGDHIGYHYDTSYYKGARYTILMGLLDHSQQCRIVCDLFKDVSGK